MVSFELTLKPDWLIMHSLRAIHNRETRAKPEAKWKWMINPSCLRLHLKKDHESITARYGESRPTKSTIRKRQGKKKAGHLPGLRG